MCPFLKLAKKYHITPPYRSAVTEFLPIAKFLLHCKKKLDILQWQCYQLDHSFTLWECTMCGTIYQLSVWGRKEMIVLGDITV